MKTAPPHSNGVPRTADIADDTARQPSEQEPQRPITPPNKYLVPPEDSHGEEPPRQVGIEVLPTYPHVLPVLPTLTFDAPAEYVTEPRTRTPEQEPVAPVPVPPSQSSRQSSKQAPVYVQLQQEDIELHPAFQELLARYNEALVELEHMRNEYAASSVPPTSDIRKRRKGPSDSGSNPGKSEDWDDSVYHQDGVPLQVVVIIALAVFITTYLFL